MGFVNLPLKSGARALVYASFASFPVVGVEGQFYYDDAGNDMYYFDGSSYVLTSGASGIANTDELLEGSTNLYYTNARVDTRIGLADLGDLADVRNSAATTDQVLAWSGSQWQPTNLEDISVPQYTLLLDEVSTTISYVGEALPGSLVGDAVWRIKKLDEGGTPELQVEWADGTADFDKVWDDRATYTYS